jgi:hypothetical protein
MPTLLKPDWLKKQETEIDGIFDQMGPLTWEVKGYKINVPVTAIQESYSNDLAKHKRLYRTGERVDPLGGFSRIWTVSSEWYNGATDKVTPGRYPDDLDILIASFKVRQWGTLTLPTAGPVRACAWTYERSEVPSDGRDYAATKCVWVEDIPDDETASQWQAPQASSVAKRYAEDTQTALADVALDGDPLGEIQAFCDDLSTLARAPSDFVSSVEGRANQTLKSIQRTEEAFTGAATSGLGELGTLLTHPSASRAGVMLRRLADTVGSARANHTSPSIITRRYPVTVSIFAVAAELKQDPVQLFAMNSRLGNLNAIPAQTPIKVFASGLERRY